MSASSSMLDFLFLDPLGKTAVVVVVVIVIIVIIGTPTVKNEYVFIFRLIISFDPEPDFRYTKIFWTPYPDLRYTKKQYTTLGPKF